MCKKGKERKRRVSKEIRKLLKRFPVGAEVVFKDSQERGIIIKRDIEHSSGEYLRCYTDVQIRQVGDTTIPSHTYKNLTPNQLMSLIEGKTMKNRDDKRTGKERAEAKRREYEYDPDSKRSWDPPPKPIMPTPAPAAVTDVDFPIIYQCVDNSDHWSTDGHKSHKQEGVRRTEDVLQDPENEGAIMITFPGQAHYLIRGQVMIPENRLIDVDERRKVEKVKGYGVTL